MKKPENAELDKLIQSIMKAADTFAEKVTAAELAMKYEALKIKRKAPGAGFGKGFDTGGNDDDE